MRKVVSNDLSAVYLHFATFFVVNKLAILLSSFIQFERSILMYLFKIENLIECSSFYIEFFFACFYAKF